MSADTVGKVCCSPSFGIHLERAGTDMSIDYNVQGT